jgi:hypothetical protein
MHPTASPAQGTQPSAAALPPDPHEARIRRLAATYAQTRAHYSAEQIAAITLLYETAQQMLDTGGGSTCGKLLLGLYNGGRFPFDLTDLRRLDASRYAAARIVMDMDARRTYAEVHAILNAVFADGRNVGAEFESWAHRLRLKGRCKKEFLTSDFGPQWERLQ